MPLQKLSALCENILLQNYLALKDLGETRYQLIEKVLYRFNPQQLIELESLNPKLMLDDETVWFNLIKKEFPQDVHERYTTNLGKIKEFFKQQLHDVGFDYSNLNLDNYITYQQLGNTKKYRLPSKLLYLKYKEDYLKKEELAIENLRQRMKAIQKDKEQNRVVHIDDIIPEPNARVRAIAKPQRSKIFMKSKIEANQRKSLFKNPSRMSIQAKSPVIRPPRIYSSSALPKQPKPTTSPTSIFPATSSTPIIESSINTTPQIPIPKPVSPVRPKPQASSVFHNKRTPIYKSSLSPSPTKLSPSPKVATTNQVVFASDSSTEQPRKRINIGKYKARKM